MAQDNTPRVLIAGTNSGCGKTTITCAILQILTNMGKKVASFKCGPDYIDPMFHKEIIGTTSANLDPFFFEGDLLSERLLANSVASDISVIEGVMGYYDGMKLDTEEGSSYSVGMRTNTPVILAVNCKGMANSVIAIIKGFLTYKDHSNISGVILNNITKTTYNSLKIAIERELPGVKVLGYLPKLPQDLVLESRHLGLITAAEIENLKGKLQELAKIASESIDIDSIIKLASTSRPLNSNKLSFDKIGDVKIAVAYDEAFCFYYRDNLSLLKELGADLVYFSPIKDEKLPSGIDGLYLGGGYPELHKEKLSANITMREDILSKLKAGLPAIAECGGFMYLTDSIEGAKMVGFLDGDCYNSGKLGKFGYLTITAKEDNMILAAGEQVKTHEFHYYTLDNVGSDFSGVKPSGVSWDCAFATDSFYGGYPHLSFYSNPNVAKRFIGKALQYRKSKVK